MNKSIKNILKNNKGETLVEVLITILLVGIVSAGFMVVVETAQSINKNVVEMDTAFYDEVSEAEVVASDDITPERKELTITITEPGGSGLGLNEEFNLTVDTYTQSSQNIVSFKAIKP